MAYTEISRGEVKLNNIAFKLATGGEVQMFYASQFAPKQVIGDYSQDSDPSRSTWSVISDQTGGIGVEDMDEDVHVKRSWWFTLNQEYPKANTLASLTTSATLTTLPTITNGDCETWGSATDCTGWVSSGTGASNFSQGTGANAHGGTYGLIITSTGGTGVTSLASRTLNGWSNDFRGKPVTIKFWAKLISFPGTGGTMQVGITDGVATTYTAATGDWTQYTVTHILNAAATGIIAQGKITEGNGGNCSAVIDDITIEANTSSFTIPPADFNSDTYFAAGLFLYRLDNSTGTIFLEGIFPASITGLIASIGSCLYAAVGTTNYYYRTTAGVWAQTDVAADKIIQWNNLFMRYVASTGQLSYTATPNTGSPSFTNKGLIDTGSQGTVNGLITYQDAAGVDQLYAGTTKGLIIHDYTNALWLNTDLKVPTHADNGKGMTVQNGNLYYSSGLSVYEFNAPNGTIRNIGLDAGDGVPDEYLGSITGLVGGFGGEFYALVDASLISTSNFSSIHKYRNGAWFVVWADSSANTSPGCGILTSTYAYRLWFSVGSTLNYQAQNRARRNPAKVSAATFAASGMYVSPWFDANWTGNKNALALRSLALSSSSSEIVTLRYRIDKTTTNVAASTAGWTTLDTLVAADAGVESIVGFASSAGVAFKQIQFRADMTRAAGTTTNRPILVYSALEYERVISSKWGWSFTVDCSQNYGNRTPLQLRDAIISIVESQTLVPFAYGGPSEPRYVRVKPAGGERLTGQGSQGIFRLVAVEK